MACDLLVVNPTKDCDTTMEAFSPEFAQYWLEAAPKGTEPAGSARPEDSSSAAQREALAALAERVNAARSIV
jgi:hypothetical protein